MLFTKVHGAGNDFVLINACQYPEIDFNKLAYSLCHRQTGIGADGLLLLLPSKNCDVRMRIINSDGSEAEMCGNGIRAFSKYAYERGIIKKAEFSVETIAGEMRPKLIFDDNGTVSAVRVNMGKPMLNCADVPVQGDGMCLSRTLEALGQKFTYSAVRVGVPVAGIPVDDPKTVDLLTWGPAIEHNPLFPARTNVAFFKVLDRENVEMRIWERGAGPTLACGTGSCATAVMTALNGLTGRSVNIHLKLATLHIEWAEDDNIYMTGPAELVYDGEIDLWECK